MEQALHHFILALRGSGVRVSTSEALESFQAVQLVGYDERRLFKHALAATLAKTAHEKERFDACFERFFSLDDFSKPGAGHRPPLEMEPSFKEAPLTQMILSGDQVGLSVSMRQAAQEVEIDRIWFFTQKSLYVQRILKAMGIENVERDIQGLLANHDKASEEKARKIRAGKDMLYEGVRNYVEKQYSLFAGSAKEDMIERYLREMRLSNLAQQDFHRMHAIVRKMVKRLNDRHSRRRKVSKKGCLDLKHTLRQNLAYQGILFELRWKTKRIERPDIVILCDVSRSVEAVSRFMLLFLYSLNEAVAKIRSFIFCSNLAEVSHVFKQYELEEVLLRLYKGTGLEVQFGRTDYGQVFQDFKHLGLDGLTKKTTVMILGDARNNYGDPRTEILNLIRKRSKRIVWLNPEPSSFWGTGDSEMNKYLPYCYLARECSTVTHLERVVDYLLRTGG